MSSLEPLWTKESFNIEEYLSMLEDNCVLIISF
jgi:hypothetical protein